MATVVVTVACCAAVIISTPISISPAGRAIIKRPPTYDMSTPQAAVVAWFEAIRAKNVSEVRRLTTARARAAIGSEALRGAIDEVGGALGQPSIVQVQAVGGQAKVRVLVFGYAGADTEPVSVAPLLVPTVRGPSGWEVDDLNYLTSSARSLSASYREVG